MVTSEQIQEIAAAGAKAQLELQPAIKDSINPAFRSKYADYAAIKEASRVYAKHGIAAWQDVVTTERGVSVTTRLTHTSGQWMEFGPLTVPMAKQDAHGVGSATTYAKRYGLSAALGIASDEDDDGNAAVQARPNMAVERPYSPPVPPPPAPDGYEQWLFDLAAVADLGSSELEGAWKASKPGYRRHLTETDKAYWDKLKAKAAAAKVVA